MSSHLFFVCGVVLISLICPLPCRSATIVWRNPGVDGRWDDPTNWRRTSDGAAVVPGPEDTVQINPGVSAYFEEFGIGVNVYVKDDVEASSLDLSGGCSDLKLLPNFNLYIYDGQGNWLGGASAPCNWPSCFVRMNVEAPSTLSLSGNLVVNQYGKLFLTGSDENPWDLPTIRSNRISFNFGDGMVGSSNFIVDDAVRLSNTSQPSQVATLRPDRTLAPFSNAGVWNVQGDLSMGSGSLRYFNNGPEVGNFSRIIVGNDNGTATLTLNLQNFQFEPIMEMEELRGPSFHFDNVSGPPSFFTADTITVLRGGDFGANETREVVLISVGDAPPLPPSSSVSSCTTANGGGNSGPAGCEDSSTDHDISVLLSSSSACGVSSSGLDCPGEPDCTGNGACVDAGGGTGVCQCVSGWRGYACEVEDCPGVPDCSSHGACISTILGVAPFCECDEGWGGPDGDCSVPMCPTAAQDTECSGNGVCNVVESPPRCLCDAGFIPGPQADCSLAVPLCPADANGTECSGRGTCVAHNNTCTCDPLWTGNDCSIPVCPASETNGIMCSGHGDCVVINETVHECSCRSGWANGNEFACEVAACPDDCNGRGTCVEGLSPPRCLCTPPAVRHFMSAYPSANDIPAPQYYTGDACQVDIANCSASPTCPSCIGVGDTVCDMQQCPENFRGWDCSLPFCPGTGTPECSGHGACVVDPSNASLTVCECDDGWELGDGRDCSVPACHADAGSNCTQHGRCRTDTAAPVCDCDPFYAGEQCRIASLPCPGAPLDECSGFGTCDRSTGMCVCNDSWGGLDCSVPLCPPSFDELQENCNGNGACDASDPDAHVCVCQDGWEGSGCEVPLCPALDGELCCGNGVCSSLTSTPSCECDAGWTGEDCCEPSSGAQDDDDGLETQAKRAAETYWPAVFAVLLPCLLCLIACAVVVAVVVGLAFLGTSAYFATKKQDLFFQSASEAMNQVVQFSESVDEEALQNSYDDEEDSFSTSSSEGGSSSELS